MRAHIETVPDGVYRCCAYVDSDGIVDEPLRVELAMTVEGSDIWFDLSRSSPPCRGPMNSVWATTQSAIYVAMKHIFPDVPINAGCFAPIHIAPPEGTFLYARYPRPVAGCAAEVAQRIMEAVFGAMGKAIPERLFAAPAGTSGNFGPSPPHFSKGEGYVLAPGDWISVKTSGGCGYGPARERDPAMVARDIARGYYTDEEAARLFARAAAAE